MREIKFRVWDGEQMVSPDYIDRNGIAHWKADSIPTISDKVMQFTGLRDKNGKEIYEGDRLRYFSSLDGNVDGTVEWNEEDSAFIVNDPEQSMFLTDWHPQTCEVIGNIYGGKLCD